MYTTSVSSLLNAFPAQIAILDDLGFIVAVNNAWREFARANFLKNENYCVGENYLITCERCKDECAESMHVAVGIRSVLEYRAQTFEFDDPCHSPTERRWFRMSVMRLECILSDRVVVMHVNVTDRKPADSH